MEITAEKEQAGMEDTVSDTVSDTISEDEKRQQIEEVVNLWKLTTAQNEKRECELAEKTDPKLLDLKVIDIILDYTYLIQSPLSPEKHLSALEDLESRLDEETRRWQPTISPQDQLKIVQNKRLFRDGEITFEKLKNRNKEIFQSLPKNAERSSNLNALSFTKDALTKDLAAIKTAARMQSIEK